MVIIADGFDAAKGYKRICFREDRDLLDSELNELQEIAIHERRELFDRVYAPGTILDSLTATVDGNQLTLTAGLVYIDGHAVSVPGGVITVGNDDLTIWVDVFQRDVGVLNDPSLVNPLTGEPTAEREKWIASLQTRDTSNDPLPEGASGRSVVPILTYDHETGLITRLQPRPLSSGDATRLDICEEQLTHHLENQGDAHALVTQTQAGFMSAPDKVTLDGLAATMPNHTHDNRYYTEGEIDTRLAEKANTNHQHDAAYAPLAHVGGGGNAHAAALANQAGFMSAGDKAKLDGIAPGATASARTATVVIAASNASAAMKAAADAICDGVDDQAEINSALTGLTNGGRVLLSEGTFIVSGSVVVPSHTVVEGQGEATILKLKDGATGSFSLITNVHAASGKDYGIEIRRLFIDGNRANQSAGWRGALHLTNAFRSVVADCVVTGAYGEGMMMENGAFNCIEGCHVEHCVLTGITIKLSDFSTVVNSRAYRNDEFGIENQASSGGKIVNSIVAGNRFDGIHATGVDLEVCNNRAFLNGQAGGNDYYNISVSGRGLVAFNIVRNDFTETGGVGDGWIALVQAYEGVSAGTLHTTSKGMYVDCGAFCVANDLYAGGANADLTLASDEFNPTVQQANRTSSTPRTNPGTWD